MKLFTHNILICNNKACKVGNFPLRILPTKVDNITLEFNAELTKKFVKKFDFPALMEAAGYLDVKNIKYNFAELKEADFENEDVLLHLHHLAFETVLVDGLLQCNGCGIKYPVNNGIADMVLND